MRSTETRYQCDNCKRTTHDQSLPTGWKILSISDEDETELPKDICDSCAQAVYSCLGKRKRIERGSYRESPMQEHLKSPEACDADAYAIAMRASRATTD